MSARIDLDLANDLKVTEDGYVTIKISPDEGNSLSIESDGLMSVGLSTINGWNASEGQILQGLTIGPVSIYNKNKANPSGRISTTGIVHRTFTAHSEDKIGEDLTGRMTYDKFRPDLDYCLPGDIFRVKVDRLDDTKALFNYYLITKVDAKKEGDVYNPGNKIARYVKLGTWGDLNTDITIDVPEKPKYKDSIDSITPGGSIAIVYDNGVDESTSNIPKKDDRVMISSNALEWLKYTPETGEHGEDIPQFQLSDRTIGLYERNFIWYINKVVDLGDQSTSEFVRYIYEPLVLQPIAWSKVYTQYYEYIDDAYEQLSSDESTFEQDKYYEKTDGYVKLTSKPANWDNDNEFLNYYIRNDYAIDAIKLSISTDALVEGSIDPDTGLNDDTDDTCLRSLGFHRSIPAGYYRLNANSNSLTKVMILVYGSEDPTNTYQKNSSIIIPRSLPCYINLEQESCVRFVFTNPGNLTNVTFQTWVDDQDIYGTPVYENTGILKYSTIKQLQSPTIFVAGWYYEISDIYEILVNKPADWDQDYTSYYKLIPGHYKQLTGGVPQFVPNKFYNRILGDIASRYFVRLTNDPNAVDSEYGWLCSINVRKAPPLDFGKIKQQNAIVMLGNAPYWDHGTPYWGKGSTEYAVDEIYSLWSIYDIDPNVDVNFDTTVKIFKESVINDIRIEKEIQVKYLDIFNNIATLIELHVGDIVSITRNPAVEQEPYWYKNDNPEDMSDSVKIDENVALTYQVISRDLSNAVYGLNNGKYIKCEYLCKIARVEDEYNLNN